MRGIFPYGGIRSNDDGRRILICLIVWLVLIAVAAVIRAG
jgi:hypothetical protein